MLSEEEVAQAQLLHFLILFSQDGYTSCIAMYIQTHSLKLLDLTVGWFCVKSS